MFQEAAIPSLIAHTFARFFHLHHSRLAMLAIAGFVAQELTNAKEIFVNLGLAPDDFDPNLLPVPNPDPYL